MTDQDQPTPPPPDDEENEVLRAAREMRAQQQAVEASEAANKATENIEKKGIGWKTAAGIGVGSAAVLAALLYANRDRLK